MSNFPKSGDPASSFIISQLQDSVGNAANNLNNDRVGRASFGPEVLNDSIVICARGFGCNERVNRDTSIEINKYAKYPETVLGFYDKNYRSPPAPPPGGAEEYERWYLNDLGWKSFRTDEGLFPIGEEDRLGAIAHREQRFRWDQIESHSSRFYAEEIGSEDGYGDTSPVANMTLPENTTEDWSGTGDWLGSLGFKNWFGDALFKIRNNSNPFSIFFSTDINLAHCYSYKKDNWDQWACGSRVWTSVIYVLKPNKHSERVLCWSPSHMIGASACVTETPGILKSDGSSTRGRSAWASIDVTHSYKDLIRINNEMIERLCDAQGIDYKARNMSLGEEAYFGWAVMGCIDRWDDVDPPHEAFKGETGWEPPGMEHYDITRPSVNGYLGLGGQPVGVNGGNTNFIVFKDMESAYHPQGYKSSLALY